MGHTARREWSIFCLRGLCGASLLLSDQAAEYESLGSCQSLFFSGNVNICYFLFLAQYFGVPVHKNRGGYIFVISEVVVVDSKVYESDVSIIQEYNLAVWCPYQQLSIVLTTLQAVRIYK